MTEDAMTAPRSGAPWHLWLVGVLSLLWNGFGAYDFIMTTTQGEAYMRSAGFDQAMIDYYNAMPAWMWGPWILGVWGAVAGSVLLLLRNKLAVWGFGLSLLGAVASLIYGLLNPMPTAPELTGLEKMIDDSRRAAAGGPDMAAMMQWMPWVILAIALFLAWYAWTMAKKGVLR